MGKFNLVSIKQFNITDSTMNNRDKSRFHSLEPDYSRTNLIVPEDIKERITGKLAYLYGEDKVGPIFQEITRVMKSYYSYKTDEMLEWEKGFDPAERFTQKDIMLITYGDLIISPKEKPLKTLNYICNKFLSQRWSIVHILPFFPHSSDRGFSVMDFEEVDPELGTWDDILDLKHNFRLMFDGVINHVSSKSKWFQEFLHQNPHFIDIFPYFDSISDIPPEQLKIVRRPRTSELLTPFDTLDGVKYVWTTFSRDQIDLNYKNPEVLTFIIRLLLYYVRRGADLIRLDAVTYLWNELGTTSASLEQTHTIVKLFRDVLDVVAPQVAIVSETNVPHKENISYFGNGYDEAQMVYNFALAPLVLITFYTGSSAHISSWASSLDKISECATYLNFLDSHDGISLQGAKEFLSKEELEIIAQMAVENGGLISYKSENDGTQSPYELNITLFSALNAEDGKDPEEIQIKRYQAARTIPLVLRGMPGFYVHGLLATKNFKYGVERTGISRDINRKSISLKSLVNEMYSDNSLTHRISYEFGEMIEKRINEKAFHPNADQKVFENSDSFFTLLRTSVDGSENILVIINVTDKPEHFKLDNTQLNTDAESWTDILSGRQYDIADGDIAFHTEPYDVLWLKNASAP